MFFKEKRVVELMAVGLFWAQGLLDYVYYHLSVFASRGGYVWKPSKDQLVWVVGAVSRGVVILQAECTPGDRPCSASKGLVESWVGY